MSAIEKIEALGIKVVHGLVVERRPGTALETIYRWRTALAGEDGVPDRVKRLLIDATSETEHPIGWLDFYPPDLRSGDPELLRQVRAL